MSFSFIDLVTPMTETISSAIDSSMVMLSISTVLASALALLISILHTRKQLQLVSSDVNFAKDFVAHYDLNQDNSLDKIEKLVYSFTKDHSKFILENTGKDFKISASLIELSDIDSPRIKTIVRLNTKSKAKRIPSTTPSILPNEVLTSLLNKHHHIDEIELKSDQLITIQIYSPLFLQDKSGDSLAGYIKVETEDVKSKNDLMDRFIIFTDNIATQLSTNLNLILK